MEFMLWIDKFVSFDRFSRVLESHGSWDWMSTLVIRRLLDSNFILFWVLPCSSLPNTKLFLFSFF